MEYYVPCPCNGEESPCFACCETGMIGPLSLYEYNAYHENLNNRIKGRGNRDEIQANSNDKQTVNR